MLTRFCAATARLCLMAAVAGLAAVVAAVLVQVFGRYVLNDTPTWAEALAMLLVLYVTMLGAAVGVRDAGHIGMESLLVLVPEKVRLKIELVIHVLVAIFGVLMAWNGASSRSVKPSSIIRWAKLISKATCTGGSFI